VEPAGKLIKSHFGVNTNILSLNTSTFKDQTNSLSQTFDIISFNSFTQSISVAISLPLSLYSK